MAGEPPMIFVLTSAEHHSSLTRDFELPLRRTADMLKTFRQWFINAWLPNSWLGQERQLAAKRGELWRYECVRRKCKWNRSTITKIRQWTCLFSCPVFGFDFQSFAATSFGCFAVEVGTWGKQRPAGTCCTFPLNKKHSIEPRTSNRVPLFNPYRIIQSYFGSALSFFCLAVVLYFCDVLTKFTLFILWILEALLKAMQRR